MSSKEFTEWVAYETIDPPLATRIEVQLAIVGAAVCGALGAKVKPKDLIPRWKPQSDKERRAQARYAQALAQSMAKATAHRKR